MEDTIIITYPKTLLVLGNGFDLNCGLESRFSDYFLEKAEFIKNATSISDSPLCDNIWDLLLYMAFYDETEKGRYFARPNKKDILWMDVESLIEKVVLKNCNYVGLREPYVDLIKSAFNFRSARLNDNSHADLLRRYFSNLEVKDTFDVYDFLYVQLKEFEKQFRDYLAKVFYESRIYKNRSNRLLKSLVNEGDAFSIISFNYTVPFASTLDSKTSCNIHGTLESGIIIGYDSSKLESNVTHGINLSKSWQKMALDLGPYNMPDKKHIKNIKIYGHSLGAQDYAYFHAIFDYYNLYDGDVVLTFCYTKYGKTEEENENIKTQLITKIHNLLSDYTINSGKESKVKTIISKLEIENRLKLEEVPRPY